MWDLVSYAISRVTSDAVVKKKRDHSSALSHHLTLPGVRNQECDGNINHKSLLQHSAQKLLAKSERGGFIRTIADKRTPPETIPTVPLRMYSNLVTTP